MAEPKYPTRHQRVRLAKLMEGRVDCEVSPRWLKFSANARQVGMGAETREMMTVDVMTTNEDGKDRKLCELILAREDLLLILNRMPVTPLSPRDE